MRTLASPEILAHLPINRGTGGPLHQQIYESIRRAILEGLLRSGQRVPSTRGLAAELGVSRLPVLSAYEQLLHEGYFTARTGAGTFVSSALPDDMLGAASAPASTTSRQATPQKRYPRRVSHAGGVRPFRVTLPALDEFPSAIWGRLVARHAHRMTPALMAYGDPAGLLHLRAAIAEHLRTARAVRCEAEQLLIVAGSQPALRLCASVLLRRGDAVAMEEPGYPGARAAFESAGARLLPVPVDAEGLDVSALAKLRRVRAVYITPSHQYPLGTSMSAARRLALLEWAESRRAWIIEDDYDSEYRYVSRPLGALQGMSASGRVVYIGTFSKVLFPSVRMGYIVVPPSLWNDFIKARDAMDVFSPTLYQLALADFIEEGHFARHLRRMRVLYKKRRDALLDGLAQHCGDFLTVHNADAGLHVATLLPPGMSDLDVVEAMAIRGLTGVPLSRCYMSGRPRHGLLLGFGSSDERQLKDGTRVLGEVLEKISGVSATRTRRG